MNPMLMAVVHILITLAILSIPYMTRSEILFGIIVPANFRSGPEGRRAIRSFRNTIAVPAVAGLLSIVLWGARSGAIYFVASGATLLLGFTAFVIQNRKLRPFAVRPDPVRELVLNDEPERLPKFLWLGIVPLVMLAVTAYYLDTHWNSIPETRPIHWGLDGQPNGWADRTARSVYGPLIFGASMSVWLYAFSFAIWYGARRTEPLRKPALVVFTAFQWVLSLIMCAIAVQALIHAPVVALAVLSMVIILGGVVYLVKVNRNARGPLDSTPAECWKGGILYYNPNDSALFVGRRDGAGFTLNLGNRWSWVVVAGLPLLMAASALLITLSL